MSYPSDLTEEEMKQFQITMKRKIPKETIVRWDDKRYKILNDTIAHGGATLLEVDKNNNVIHGSKKLYVTLYLHGWKSDFPQVLSQPYDKDSIIVYYKGTGNSKKFYKYDEYGERHKLTKQEYIKENIGYIENEKRKNKNKYDKKSNLVYYKDYNNHSEHWYEYDEKNNCIYEKSGGYERWNKFDKSNRIYYKDCYGHESWYKYDKNNKLIYEKYFNFGREYWYKWDNNKQIEITEQEFNEIEFRKKEKEYLSRIKCSRFELIDI